MLTQATCLRQYVDSVHITWPPYRRLAAMANITVRSSYQQTPPADQWDAIVIGSGIGGLAASALLAKHSGKRVLVLERHYVAGGFTHSFHRPGYRSEERR